MQIEGRQTKELTISESAAGRQPRPTRPISSRKIEANRRNAQLSTGPNTPEGKATSSRNAITHGIFVTQFLNRATPETVAQVEELARGMREYYKPEGMLEEMLVEKIVIETARYGRALEFENPEPNSPPPYILSVLGLAARYTTATSRALFRAIEELERLQAARKARKTSAASVTADSAPAPSQLPDSSAGNSGVLEDGGAVDPVGEVGAT